MHNTPVVSFVMAMYNAEATVAGTIRSLIAQTRSDWELVAVDDASRDGTFRVVEAFDDPRIRVIRQPQNAGQAAALTRGLHEARADLIARIDADDLCVPERLERQIPWLDQHPEVTVLSTRASIFDEAHSHLGIVSSVRGRAAQLRTCLVRNRLANHVSVLARRAPLLAAGGYSPQLPVMADVHLWTRLILRGEKFAQLDDVLVRILRARATFSATSAAGERLAGEHSTLYLLLGDEFDVTVSAGDARLMGHVVAGTPDRVTDDEILEGTARLARFQQELLKGRATDAERRYASHAASDVFWEHVVRRLMHGKRNAALRLASRGCPRTHGPASLLASLVWWLSLGKSGRQTWAPPVPGGSALDPQG